MTGARNAVSRGAAALLAAALLTAAATAPAAERDYLDTGEALTIAGVSAGLAWGSLSLRESWAPSVPRWTEPSALDLWAAEHLGADPSAESVNIMQRDGAEFANAAAFGVMLAAADLTWPIGDKWKDTGQDQLLYWSGQAALSGVQQIVKGVVGRQRPLARLYPDVAAQREHADPLRDQRSFWSGHASSAFFASTFLNLRMREIMRREMSGGDYADWRWAPPTVLYGWATYVAYSRVQGNEHWLTDVLVGAAAGWGFAELFYALDDRSVTDAGGGSADVPLFTFAIGF